MADETRSTLRQGGPEVAAVDHEDALALNDEGQGQALAERPPDLRQYLAPIEPERQVSDWGRSERVEGFLDRTLYDFFYNLWFRCEVEGIEHVPAAGGALLVSNHSGAVPPQPGRRVEPVVRQQQPAVLGDQRHRVDVQPQLAADDARHVEEIGVGLRTGRERLIVGARDDAGLVCLAPFLLQIIHMKVKVEVETAHGFHSRPGPGGSHSDSPSRR